jgi:AmiR/NasT family two-component response regulator
MWATICLTRPVQALRPLCAGLPIMEQSPTCVVMLTANTDDVTMEQAGNYGAAGYIPKPITSDNLLPVLKQALQMFSECHP